MRKATLLLVLLVPGLLLGGCLGPRGPTAVISTDPAPPEGMQPLTVKFDGSDSYGEGIQVYEWEVSGPGSEEPDTVEGEQITWVFEEPGEYAVKLTVRSASGRTSSATVRVSVGPRPVASFRIEGERSPDGGFYFNRDVEFDATASTDAVRWMWEFSDNYTAEGQIIRRSFLSLGNYTVTLVVESEDGVQSYPYTRSFRIVGRCCGQ